ncbi:nickel pincer cofactor biosynthesis protein LarC [Paenibacillus sepulcri]|uniref:Pyridinium-3,5-bisthiocarboxylic acid mononucleotide nickel insertion protein n=1 Tax=Paenibacillus sepulcri TaxID=359917 RepID=A0ABS7C1N0_9BACL|nr:nickel pincer cofactor biosynthesis protein LarC [Paenibacillus sepulcri]
MKVLYLDCISGIAGDMALAALIDVGADLSYIESHLKALPIDPFSIAVDPVIKKGISAKKLRLHIGGYNHDEGHSHIHRHDDGHSHSHAHSHDDGHTHSHAHIHDDNHSHSHAHTHDDGHTHSHAHTHDDSYSHAHTHDDGHSHAHTHDDGHSHTHSHEHTHGGDHEHHHRKASDILRMIAESGLPGRVKQRSTAIFQTIAKAEGKIHGMSPEEVHFHEVGAMDSIIDTIGVCLAMENLGIEEIYASPVPTGHGKLKMAHGLYPIPAPATAEILIGIPIAKLDAAGELTTPTGAGILKALAKGFGDIPALTIERIGYGAGTKEFAHPNVIRALLMEQAGTDEEDSVMVMEAQLDDMTGEALGYTMERLFEAGAVDVFFTPVYMKKNRPATLVTVLAPDAAVPRCEDVLLLETTTLGVRRTKWTRRILKREMALVATAYGPVRIKLAIRESRVFRFSPEYEDVAKAAREHGLPFQDMYKLAVSAGEEYVSNHSA